MKEILVQDFPGKGTLVQIDINCDMGESFGAYGMGEDERIVSLVTSANIACGFHAGDPMVMARTVELALRGGAAVGAHPGYPDLLGFGRREMETFPGEIRNYILYQVGALSAFVRAGGAKLRHVKPHGALYNLAARDEKTAREVIDAVRAFDPELILVALAGSLCAEMAEAAGLRVAREAFPDRAYLSDGRLAPRSMAGSVIHDPELVRGRVQRLIASGTIECLDGGEIALSVDTLCVHGDAPGALRAAEAIHGALAASGVSPAPMRTASP